MSDMEEELTALFREATLVGVDYAPQLAGRALAIVKAENICTCDEHCDDPCPKHQCENQLQDRALKAEGRLIKLREERDRLDKEFSEALSTSTRRIGEIAILREQAKRLRASLGEERDMRVAYDKSRSPRSGEFADQCVPLLHRLCDATRERWTACLVMWAAEMLNTGTAADVALRKLVAKKEEKARG